MSAIEPLQDPTPGVWTQVANQPQIDAQSVSSSCADEGSKERPGPFTLAVKANIAVRGFRCSAACAALDVRAEHADAPVVAMLRQAGAIVVGMTNMHELAFGITSDNASFGPVRLPGHPQHSAGGSSGGSAAAVASRAADVALGTDTGGSVSIPASLCGIVGFRPSTGRWPTAGCIGLSHTRDTPGVFTKSVQQATRIDGWVTNVSTESSSGTEGIPELYRLGLPYELLESLHPATQAAFEQWQKRLPGNIELIDIKLGETLDLVNRAASPIVMWEARRLLGDAAARAMAIDPETAFEKLAHAVQSPDVRAIVQSGLATPTTADEYAAAQAAVSKARQLQAAMFATNRLDGLVFPTTPAPAPRVGENDTVTHLGAAVDTFSLYTRNTGQGTMLGAPMVTLPLPVPAGQLPVGITVQGPRFHDGKTLAVAANLEAELHHM